MAAAAPVFTNLASASTERDPVRAALEEATRRPLPSPDERARLMALVAETGKDAMTVEELRTKLAARRPSGGE